MKNYIINFCRGGRYANLCETRWTGNWKMIHEDHVLIYSGEEDHRNGIGIMMTKSVNASLIGF